MQMTPFSWHLHNQVAPPPATEPAAALPQEHTSGQTNADQSNLPATTSQHGGQYNMHDQVPQVPDMEAVSATRMESPLTNEHQRALPQDAQAAQQHSKLPSTSAADAQGSQQHVDAKQTAQEADPAPSSAALAGASAQSAQPGPAALLSESGAGGEGLGISGTDSSHVHAEALTNGPPDTASGMATVQPSTSQAGAGALAGNAGMQALQHFDALSAQLLGNEHLQLSAQVDESSDSLPEIDSGTEAVE